MNNTDIAAAFSFPNSGPPKLLYDATLHLLDSFRDGDLSRALASDTMGEARAHAAGRTEALMEFKQAIEEIRQKCRPDQDI